MYILKHKYEDMLFDEITSHGGGICTLQEKITSIHRKIRNLIIDEAKKNDEQEKTIGMKFTSGIESFSYEELIVTIDQFKNGKIQKKYPDVKFSNLNYENIYSNFSKIGKTLSYDMTGHREHLEEAFNDLTKDTNEKSFQSEFPSEYEALYSPLVKTMTLDITEKDYNSLKNNILDIEKSFDSLHIEIIEHRNSNSFLVKYFNKKLIIELKLNGNKIDILATESILKLNN